MEKHYSKNYAREELMSIEASRFIKNTDTAILGTGLPMVAAIFAQKTHAPGVNFVVESGSIDPLLPFAPFTVADPIIGHMAVKTGTLRDVLGCLVQRGLVDIGFLGGAEIDQFGNINSTSIGNPRKPIVRFPGSGGANCIASCVPRILIVALHEKRRFPPRVQFITSPGYIDGPDGRKKVGLRMDRPDIIVVTDLCVMQINPNTGRLELTKLMPGVTTEEVYENTGFEPKLREKMEEVELPTEEELKILRAEVDPDHIYLKEFLEQQRA
jgi:acyl CoA:acetate/3-ketoacid CoA transferase beta subunit